MRNLPLAVFTSLTLLLAACTGSDDDAPPSGTGGGAGASNSGDAGAGDTGARAGTGTGGSLGTGQVEFTDLPGKIRFVNFVSDGTDGVNLDLYWGISLDRSEKVGVVAYGEVTDFLTPRHSDEPVLKADEARFFLVREGDVSGNPSTFLVQDDPSFTADTVLTVALAATDGVFDQPLAVFVQTIYEAKLSTPPAGMAHVFAWSAAFSQIEDGDFVLVGTDALCQPERGESGGTNVGVPALIPEGSTNLALFDANTEPPCDSGTPPITETVEAGHSYVLLGEAQTYELDARRTTWLELGTQN